MRHSLPVDALPFVGGNLSVDFVNTTGARDSQTERERLRTYGDLLTWCRRAGLLSTAETRRLEEAAARNPAAARRALRKARKFRESLYQVLRGKNPSTRDMVFIDKLFRLERQRRELVRRGARYELRRRDNKDELDCMIWPIVSSASELLTSVEIEKLKRCGECDWLFLDDSKNRSRRWCKKLCGDRVRARRHYARHGARVTD